MRGTIWTVVALGTGLAFVPLVLGGIEVGDETAETAMQLLGAFGGVLGLAFVIATFGLLIAFFTDSGGF